MYFNIFFSLISTMDTIHLNYPMRLRVFGVINCFKNVEFLRPTCLMIAYLQDKAQTLRLLNISTSTSYPDILCFPSYIIDTISQSVEMLYSCTPPCNVSKQSSIMQCTLSSPDVFPFILQKCYLNVIYSYCSLYASKYGIIYHLIFVPSELQNTSISIHFKLHQFPVPFCVHKQSCTVSHLKKTTFGVFYTKTPGLLLYLMLGQLAHND